MSKEIRIVFQAEPDQAKMYMAVSNAIGMPMSELFRRATAYYVSTILERKYGREIAKQIAKARNMKAITVLTTVKKGRH